jgi:hypothetical protein
MNRPIRFATVREKLRIGIWQGVKYVGCRIALKKYFASRRAEISVTLGVSFLLIFFFPCSSPAPNGYSASVIKRHITIYGSSDLLKTDLESIAKYYHIVITEWWNHEDVAKLKKLNPNIKVLFYRDLIGILESFDDWKDARNNSEWFLKDADKGARIKHKDHHWYLMDITNQDYQRHTISYINSKLEKYPVFDGVFLDDVISSPNKNRFSNEFDKGVPQFGQKFISSYRDSMIEVLSSLKNTIGSKLVIINSNDEDEFIKHTDGIMFEGFITGSWQEIKYMASDSAWSKHMNLANKYKMMNKFVLLHSGTKEKGEEATHAFAYAFGSYLLLADANTSFFFDQAASKKTVQMYQEYYYDVRRSDAKNIETSTDGKNWMLSALTTEGVFKPNIYRKNFMNMLIVINPTSMTYHVNIPMKYCELRGDLCVSQMNKSSAIIFKE